MRSPEVYNAIACKTRHDAKREFRRKLAQQHAIDNYIRF